MRIDPETDAKVVTLARAPHEEEAESGEKAEESVAQAAEPVETTEQKSSETQE